MARIEVQCHCRCCGETFWRYPADVKAGGGQYCSRKCVAKGQSGRRNSQRFLDGGKVQVDLSVTRVVTTVHKPKGARR